MTRSEALSCLPSDLPACYHKKMITCHHTAVGGVTTAICRFVHYTRWQQVLSCPSLITSDLLPRTLQTALSDTVGPSAGGDFEAREGMSPPEAVGVRTNASGMTSVPVFSGDKLGPDLALLPFNDVRFWVLSHSVYSRALVLRQVRISKLMAIWDYEGKLEAWGWDCIQEQRALRARLSAIPAKML